MGKHKIQSVCVASKQCNVFHSTRFLLLRGRPRHVWTGLVGNHNVWCLDKVENLLPLIAYTGMSHFVSMVKHICYNLPLSCYNLQSIGVSCKHFRRPYKTHRCANMVMQKCITICIYICTCYLREIFDVLLALKSVDRVLIRTVILKYAVLPKLAPGLTYCFILLHPVSSVCGVATSL